MGTVTGIVVASDILRLYSGRLESLREGKMSLTHAMKREVISTTPEKDLSEAAGLMLRHKVGGLPVIEEGELVGIITESDVVRLLV